jgi:hypothetical protein
MYDKMKKNNTLSVGMQSSTTNAMATACLSSLDIMVRPEPNANRSLLDEEDSSNVITNLRIVDSESILELDRKLTNNSHKRFGSDASDPWYKPDSEASEYIKKNRTPEQNLQNPDLTALAAAIYSVNEALISDGAPSIKKLQG